MFPGSYEFHWDVGHVVFLGAFFTVLTVVGITALVAWHRGRAQAHALPVEWAEGFGELPTARRICRHALERGERSCDRAFDCRGCAFHAERGTAAEGSGAELRVHGLRWPLDRAYHRGHTWARPREDGDVEIGLDEFAQRVVGRGEVWDEPALGEHLRAFAPAWRQGGSSPTHVMSPVDGTVVEKWGSGASAVLRLHPDGPWPEQGHLLRGAEVRPWVESELAALRRGLGVDLDGATLPDGGALLEDLPAHFPGRDWSALAEDLLLND